MGLGDSMQVGTIVRMKGDPWKILGLIVWVGDDHTIKIKWLDELCDPTFVDQWTVEVICK